MATRIRYTSPDGRTFYSVQSYPSVDGTYSVALDLQDKTFLIVRPETGAAIAFGSAKSAAQLKNKAKQALIRLGVQFAEETRNR